jgi:para-nitrobenzyl esterase
MMISSLLVLATASASILNHAIAASISTIISIDTGTILGNPRDANGILSFKGIPYAAPPIGNLRWKSPQAPASFKTTFNATVYGASCYASSAAEEPYFTPASEDCLFLNVWTGATLSTEKRPVMVFLPGGGFQFGSSAQPTYDGSHLATNGVLVVTLNYRLGVFGFLGLTGLDAEGTSSGNYGLQDQIAALKWVQQNIASFGGDPTKVTLFGESAGAHAVGMLMTSSLTNGLFSKAILESGAFWDSEAGPLATYQQARTRGAAFQASVGASSLAQLRAMSAVAINAAEQWIPTTDPKISAFSPSIDYYVLDLQPGMAFANGLQHKIPLLAGFNGDEGALFAPYGLSETNRTKYEDGLQLYFTSHASQALTLYPDSTSGLLQDSATNLIGDMVIREQTYTALNCQQATPGIPANSVFVYYFTYTSPYSPIAIHTAELPFVFGNLVPDPVFGPTEGAPTPQDVAFSNAVVSYWTNFAKTGNPNGIGVPTWPAYTGDGGDFLQLGTSIAAYNYNNTRLQFIASFRSDGVLPANWINILVNSIN